MMACSQIEYLVAVLFAVFETYVQAFYYLDDTDSSIRYVGTLWGMLQVPPDGIDSMSRFHNHTLEAARCRAEDGCTMTISFDGSGITLYGLKWRDGLSFNASIDGGTPTHHRFDPVYGPPTSPNYNFPVYDVTSLPLGNHTLLLTLLESTVINADNDTLPWPSLIYFDYALVESPNNAKPAISSRSVMIGPAIVGTIGGIIVISTIIIMIVRMRRPRRPRRTRRDTVVINSDANILAANIDVSRSPIVGASRHPSDDPSNSPNSQIPHSPSLVPPSTSRMSPPMEVVPPGRHTPTLKSSDSALAAEEARFLRRLYDRNAPADEIAKLMRAMRAREEGNSRMAASGENAEPESSPDGRG